MTSNLIILDINIPYIDGDASTGWQTPRIFNEETDLASFDAAVKEAQKKRYTVSTKFIHGMAVEPLRQYLADHPGSLRA